MRHILTPTAIAGLLVMLGATAIASDARAGPRTTVDASHVSTTTLAYPDRAWCSLFTDEGSLMPVEACMERLQGLLGDPGSRAVPQSLLPLVIFLDPPDPAVRRFTVKGRGSRSSRPFTIPLGASYLVSVETKGCGPGLRARLRDAAYVPPPDTLDTFGIAVGDGAKVWDPGEGDYRINVISTRSSRKKPCTWRYTFVPIVAADYVDLEGFINTVILPVPEWGTASARARPR